MKHQEYETPTFTIMPIMVEDIITLSNVPPDGGIELPDDIWRI